VSSCAMSVRRVGCVAGIGPVPNQEEETMAKFVLVYRGSPTYRGSPDAMEVWERWFQELGGQLVDRGNPVFDRTVLGAGSADTVLAGYSVVEAEDMAAATKLSEGCPALAHGGAVEAGVLTELNRGTQRLAER
jgi:hypothetical protein